MATSTAADSTYSSHIHLKFFTKDARFQQQLPDEVINVPASSDSEHLNLLVNKIAHETDNEWKPENFDFLIDSILLRTSLFDFVETYKLSLEDALKVECICQTPAPEPQHELHDTEWIAGVKILDPQCIFTINYGGELTAWTGDSSAKEMAKSIALKLDNEPLKCLDLFRHQNESFLLVGAQNQTLILVAIEKMAAEKDSLKPKRNKQQSKKFTFTPKAVFRGHQRSVESVAVNGDGTRALSGSFDKCMKVWDIETENPENDGSSPVDFDANSRRINNGTKRLKLDILTKTPLVTLEAHREAVVRCCWHPHEPGQAVTVSWDHQMLLWDLELAGPVASLISNKAFTALALNPMVNGLAVTGSTDPLIRMWDLRSKEGSMVKSTYFGHFGWVSDVCWCPNRENLFISASYDKTVKMWDIRSPKAALYDLIGHEDRVLCVDWSSSSASTSERIASGSVDSTLKVFAH